MMQKLSCFPLSEKCGRPIFKDKRLRDGVLTLRMWWSPPSSACSLLSPHTHLSVALTVSGRLPERRVQLSECSFNGGATPALLAISCLQPGMSSSGSSSSSRKEFDVKQILRIRWRWFGHTALPPTHSPPLEHFAGRRAGGSPGDRGSVSGCSNSTSAGVSTSAGGYGLVSSGSAGSNLCHGSSNRKFAEAVGSRGGAGAATGSSCPRSLSQPECRSSAAALSWESPPPHRRSRPLSSMEPSGEVPLPQLPPEPSVQLGLEEDAAAAAAMGAVGTEDNNNNPPETDSSSCR